MTARLLLGTHQPGWLGKAGVPLFVSDTRLRVYKTLPRAVAPWGCDSGGFTELQKFGRWTIEPRDYLARLRRYRDEIGELLWAAPQDWMCEPIVINGGQAGPIRFAGSHLSVAEHQRRTVLNFALLRELAPDLPIIPVVQGWERDDYLRCADLYTTLIGYDLATAPLVGVGSVCRRQGTRDAGRILRALHIRGVRRLHGFGFKTLGLAAHGHLLTSADSLAWSDVARKLRRPALPQCVAAGRHRNCANCLPYALHWRTRVLAAAARPAPQPALFDWEAAA
ncbi:hypothetical protein Aab01nite_85930 [Paractinoplanes abujensis]|uniref:DeoxyPurine in DNA protein A domain-containing protein n=1 Tax=Paractinoplanes abujensis TaxID=882441 RepID=A0A7W7G4K8_9ACTN|nr:hypothetical protein [Actinoplanes abujensis]MBB4695395.1 hypothetical protein [Actinoplanes abujensis]GID25003.1 hypothetical protein Aab01nite_85930 [Actinoplanes abujensis]